MKRLYHYDGKEPRGWGSGSFEPGSYLFSPGKHYWLEPDHKVLGRLPFTAIEPPDCDGAPTLAERVAVLQDWMDTVGRELAWGNVLRLAGSCIERLVDDALRAGFTEEVHDADTLTAKDLRLFLNRVKVWVEGRQQESVQAAATPEAKAGVQPKVETERPKILLTGWHDICSAVGMPYSRHNEVKSLNARFKGPIKNAGAGTKPMVYREDLLDWYNQLAIEADELVNRRKGARMSAEAQYNYGREGTAAPEIGGGVKRRRRPRQT